MKLMVRAHDLSVKGAGNINDRLCELGLDGVQFVAYKSIDGVACAPNQLTQERAKEISLSLWCKTVFCNVNALTDSKCT